MTGADFEGAAVAAADLALAVVFVAILGAFLGAGAGAFLGLTTLGAASAWLFLAGITMRSFEPTAAICKIILQKIPHGFSFCP
jgi:hypothetical protein